MRALDKLGMAQADIGALSRDMPERPLDRRRQPALTPAVEERNRLEERDRARDRARDRLARIERLREDESLKDLAPALGVPLAVAEEAFEGLRLGREPRPELMHALGARGRRRLPRSEVVEALGGDDCYEEICEGFTDEVAGRTPATSGTDVRPLTRTAAETRDFLGELAESARERVA